MKFRKILAPAVVLAILSVASPVLAQPLTDNFTALVQVGNIPARNLLSSPLMTLMGKFLGVFIGTATFILGSKTYKREQKWKYREFAAQTIKAFEEKLETVNVRKMLNSESQLIDLFPTASHPSNRFIYIDDQTLIKSLENQKDYDEKLQEAQIKYQRELENNNDYPRRKEPKLIQAAIRDNFRSFAESLQLLEAMIQSELVTEDELKPYLKPLFEMIDQASKRELDESSESERCSNILTYLGLDEKQTEPTTVQKSVKSLAARYQPTRLSVKFKKFLKNAFINI
ncbi:MAG: hypothetical protein QQW96_18215 [Tychonema bourrellyi B0820]|uniref:Uncharacterized protein n=1 Tax=Tychonema bourrellyi FEM_GT703 TaxID=2040638 RepID=A0A2G4EXJ5_9CYAN|nr:hypothetical protein [Tychonema bourrellyi]MDQ2099569.1 hypothetical protein [Tychonema bourrellyi B0820]PHX54196.1 hypothetical protein CP500_017445 [Tychonema bourrellyi FEM_GT703]